MSSQPERIRHPTRENAQISLSSYSELFALSDNDIAALASHPQWFYAELALDIIKRNEAGNLPEFIRSPLNTEEATSVFESLVVDPISTLGEILRKYLDN